MECLVEGDVGAGDGSGAGAAIGLEDVAVDDDHALAEAGHVHDGAEAASDEALNLLMPAFDATGGLPCGAGEG